MSLKSMTGKHLLLAGVILGIAIFSSLSFFWGCEKTLKLWGVPTWSPAFPDTRVITSGAESKALGFDPLVHNVQDPWGLQLNYPRIWQMLYLLGVNQSHTAYFWAALVVLFAVGLFLYTPSTLDRTTAAVLVLSLFSPAVLLGVEVGNIDFLMFFLLAAAIFSMKQKFTGAKALAVALVLVAFILKLYPLFGIALTLSQPRKFALKAGLLAGIFAAFYVGATCSDIAMIRRATPPFPTCGYGLDMLCTYVGGRALPQQIMTELNYVAVAVCLVLALFGIFSARFGNIEMGDTDQRTMDAFRVGSAIYLGTFLLWDNGNYRLVFLLFVIPQLMFWTRSASRCIAFIARITLLATIGLMWSLLFPRVTDVSLWGLCGKGLLYIVSLLNFGGLLFLLFCSAPQWIKDGAANLEARLQRRKGNPLPG
jgi:hypothetical protein